MKLTRLLLALLTAFSGCAIQRPNADLCVVNGAQRRCFNLQTDYDDDGHIIAGHNGIYRANATLGALNKATIIDSPTGYVDGLAALKAYIAELRKEYQNNCQPLTSGTE